MNRKADVEAASLSLVHDYFRIFLIVLTAVTIKDSVLMVFVVPVVVFGGIHVIEVHEILRLVWSHGANQFAFYR